jgi:hypothetical protein
MFIIDDAEEAAQSKTHKDTDNFFVKEAIHKINSND